MKYEHTYILIVFNMYFIKNIIKHTIKKQISFREIISIGIGFAKYYAMQINLVASVLLKIIDYLPPTEHFLYKPDSDRDEHKLPICNLHHPNS